MYVKYLMAAAALALAPFTSQAAVAPVSAEASTGTFVLVTPGRDAVSAAFDAENGNFFSLGLGGVIVFDFGQTVGGMINLTEVTFGDTTTHLESVELLSSSTYGSGSFDLSSFTSIGSVTNTQAVGGTAIGTAMEFRYLALVDTSSALDGSLDGFDIDFVTAMPIPLPGSVWALLGGLVGLGLLGHRRAASAA